MSDLSQLNAVRAFEAVARTGSYALAAKELHVTPAAVGQQVRAFEAWLGTTLFHRMESGTKRLVLTENAKAAAHELRTGLEAIERGVRRLRAPARVSLTITASHAFVGKWLVARLDAFTNAHPTLDVRLDVSDRMLDFRRGEADAGIRFGHGSWPGALATRLVGEEVFPVCAPSLLSARHRRRSPGDLGKRGRFTLIHDLLQDATGALPTWEVWLDHAGMKSTASGEGGLRINSSFAAIQAAIRGQGVALARAVLVRDDIEAGSLVRLLPHVSYPVAWAYHFVRSAEGAEAPQVRAFRTWLRRALTV